MGKAQVIQDFMRGLSSGVLHEPLVSGMSEAFMDGWGQGRLVGQQVLVEYLQSRGLEFPREVELRQLVE